MKTLLTNQTIADRLGCVGNAAAVQQRLKTLPKGLSFYKLWRSPSPS